MAAKSKSSSDLISLLEPYFTKQAPFQIPKKWRENLVNWIPWINLVIGILLLPAVLFIVGLGTVVGVVAPLTGNAAVSIFYWLSLISVVICIAILFITFPGLKARKLSAWKLVFWADIVYLAYGILSALSNGDILSIVTNIIGTAIALFVLFQIKSYYK